MDTGCALEGALDISKNDIFDKPAFLSSDKATLTTLKK